MPKTLVVDDDERFLSELVERAKALADDGLGIITASCDRSALDIMTSGEPLDIALVSIDGGAVSGMGLFQKLNGVKLRIPRIAITAVQDLGCVRRAMNAGAADFLLKPICFDDLRQTVHRVFVETERRRDAWRTESALAALRREVDIAGDIQQRLLPKAFPARNGLDMFAQVTPAKEMGGDFYDFFDLPSGHVAIVVADVAGKGVPAAFVMAVIRTLVRSKAALLEHPARCLAAVNDALCQHEFSGMFVSVFYAVLDVETGILLYSNAGHLPPILARGDTGKGEYLRSDMGVVLGVQAGLEYLEDRVFLEPDDCLVCYTDGMTEAFDHARNQFSEDRLLACVEAERQKEAKSVTESLFASVMLFTGDTPQSDDITGLVIRRSLQNPLSETNLHAIQAFEG